MHRLAGAKIHQRCWQEGPRTGGLFFRLRLESDDPPAYPSWHGVGVACSDFAERKPGQFDVIKLKFDQPLQFGRQQLAVPTRQFSQPIISDDVGAPIGRREIGQTNRRKGGTSFTMA